MAMASHNSNVEEINAPPYLGFTMLASTAKHVAIGLARIGCNSEYTGVIWPLVQYARLAPFRSH